MSASPVRPRDETPHPLEALAQTHYDAIHRFAMRLCGSPAEASDLVQDAFERALCRYDSFDPSANALTWLFSIVHHAFIDRCRRKRLVVSIDGADAPDPTTDEPLDPPEWASLTESHLRAAVDALAGEFQAVYRMHAFEGRSYQEISAELGIPVNTVGTRLRRARAKLKELLSAMSPKREEAQ